VLCERARKMLKPEKKAVVRARFTNKGLDGLDWSQLQ
jgi:hypothetical protein